MFVKITHILNDSAVRCLKNTTQCPLPTVLWSVIPIFNLTFMFVNILLNGVVLCRFIKYRHLRTPFAIYLMNLLFTDLSMSFVQTPIKIVAHVYSSWTILNPATCTINLYGGAVIGGGIMMSHVLITANRVWAMTWPISYRARHTRKMAVLAVAAMSTS